MPHVDYLGGHPSRSEPKSTAERRGHLIADDFGVHLRSLKGAMPGFQEFFVIPWSEMAEVVVEGSGDTTCLSVGANSYTCGFEIHKSVSGEVRRLLARWTEWLPGASQ